MKVFFYAKLVYIAGSGGFSKVFRGTFQGRDVAIKEARCDISEPIEVTAERVGQVSSSNTLASLFKIMD